MKFQHENVGRFETVANIKEDGDFYTRYVMIGGQMHDGKYLTHMYYNYDFGEVGYVGFAAVDLTTGKYDMLKTYNKKEPNFSTFYYMDAMTTDPISNRLVGLSHLYENYNPESTVRSHIGLVDPATGLYEEVEPMEDFYFCIDYDNDGTLWAARWDYNEELIRTGACLVTLDPAQGYKETSKVNLTMDGNPFMMYFDNSMRFDPSTDELFMLATDYGGSDEMYTQYMAKVDTKTGVMTSLGNTSLNQLATGLYIPGLKGSTRGCAAAVTELTSTFTEGGDVVLSWKNPTITWNRNELTEMAEVLVCRDNTDNVVATLKDGATVGGSMTWTDTEAPRGLHTYYVIPCRVEGERGVPNSWNAFAGHDVPTKPGNVTISTDGATVTMSWTAPEIGAQDGWFDKATLKYNIKRHPDEVMVAEGITGTTFTDNSLDVMQGYFYDIIPVTADGEGLVATTDNVIAGKAYTTPFATDLKTDAEQEQWTVLDLNGDGYKFDKCDWEPFLGLKIGTSAGANNDFAISPSIKLEAGKTYKTMWTLFIKECAQSDWQPDNHNDFRFTAGQGLTAEAQSTEMLKVDNYQTSMYNTLNDFETFFTAEADGEYNFGLNITTSNCEDIISLKKFSVKEVFDKDMAAIAFEGTINPSKGLASDYEVTVKNEGGKDIDGSFKVQIVRTGDNNVVLGETEFAEGLKSQESTVVKVSATPDVEGEFMMAAAVVLDGDQNKDNDVSEPKAVTAAREGLLPINYEINGDFNDFDSRVPMSFTKPYSHSESVYLASELKGVTKIHRLGLTYDTTDPLHTGEFDVQVYLALTDKEGYDPHAEKEYTPLSQMTKVYDGTLTLTGGTASTMVFDFDEPFSYDDSKNLLVTILKQGESPSNSFPALFHQYNYNWDAELYRTIRFENSDVEEAVDGMGNFLPNLPVLSLAVETSSADGIGNITLGGAVSFGNGTISVNGGDVAKVEVFDIAGRKVFGEDVAAGQASLKASLNAGIYMLKVTGRDGKVYTQKIRTAGSLK